MALIEERDREFHRHIVKNRVDPTAQSATNPVPDFYGEQAPGPGHDMYRSMSFTGEKIGSLHQYRQVGLVLSPSSLPRF
jgi:import inner membrane translocase subunit TIM23